MTPSAAAPTGRPADAPPTLVADEGAVRTITLNRPAAFNSFDSALKPALLAALADAAADPAVRALVITGAGRAFCAGQDLKEHLALVAAGDERVGRTVSDFFNPLVRTVLGMRKPVIAAVNGPAAGAGAGLAFACDLRVAAASATFSMAFAGVGLSADTGASYLLPRLVGHGRASRMMLLGEKVDAAEAGRIGLVDEVVDDDALAATVRTLAARLADGPTMAYGWIKASLQHGAEASLDSTLDFEDRAQTACFASADHHEAIRAFVEKVRTHHRRAAPPVRVPARCPAPLRPALVVVALTGGTDGRAGGTVQPGHAPRTRGTPGSGGAPGGRGQRPGR
jgi:2-(1,2-epoxy-1,2-dihydrophenyl)acetyl-CoA isomerase